MNSTIAAPNIRRLTTLGIAVTALGAVEEIMRWPEPAVHVFLGLGIAVAMGLSVALYRVGPATALAFLWLGAALQYLSGTDVRLAEFASAAALYGSSRYGSRLTAVAGGGSVLLAYGAALAYLRMHGTGIGMRLGEGAIARITGSPIPFLLIVSGLPLALPWLIGLFLRLRARIGEGRQARAAADALRVLAEAREADAEEVAKLRREQAQLARDVHDVVGHSLAVILAQADSAAFVGDDPERIQNVLANIAQSARTSLGDVRRVLSEDIDGNPVEPRSLETLLDGVANAGIDVRRTIYGEPTPLARDGAETEVFRVFQEMLTNAIKHGSRPLVLTVEIDWRTGLALEVRNPVGRAGEGLGMGIDGMRQRMESIHGTLTARAVADQFIVKATAPN